MEEKILETIKGIRVNHNRPDSEAIHKILRKDIGDELDLEYFKITLRNLEENGLIENRSSKDGVESFYVVEPPTIVKFRMEVADFSCQVEADSCEVTSVHEPVSRAEFKSLKDVVNGILQKHYDKDEETEELLLSLRNEISWLKKELSSKDLIINILQENIGSKESMVRDNTMLSHKNGQINLKKKFKAYNDDFKAPKRYAKSKNCTQHSNLITPTQNHFDVLSDTSSEDDNDNENDCYINYQENIKTKSYSDTLKNSKSLAQHPRSNKKNIKQRKVVVIGDSMIKGVKPWSMRKSLKQNIQLKSFAGAKLGDMEHYIIPSKKSRC